MPPHEFTALDFAAVGLALLAGCVAIGAGLLRVVGPPWGQPASTRGAGLLPLLAGAVTIFLAVVAIGDYASWDGTTRPATTGATAQRLIAAAALIFACGLALRWTRRVARREE